MKNNNDPRAIKWTTWEGVTNIGEYWWWNGDWDSSPVPVSILSSYAGNGKYTYFATLGQLGWTRAQDVWDMGGWWKFIPTPDPVEELRKEGHDIRP